MKVEIRKHETQELIGTFTIKLKSVDHRPLYDEVFGAAWRWVKNQKLVDHAAKEDDYDLYLIFESFEEQFFSAPLNPKFGQKVLDAHKHSIRNKDEILNSEVCGCFGCLAIMKPTEITHFTEEKELDGVVLSTAWCPNCLIDTVIGSSSGYPITREFLKVMNKHWCGGRAE